MINYFSFVLPLSLILVLSLHWSDAASLPVLSHWLVNRRHPVQEFSTSEPILSRRRPILNSMGRRRRWMKAAVDDDDEMEVLPEHFNTSPIEETTTMPTENSSAILILTDTTVQLVDSTSTFQQDSTKMDSNVSTVDPTTAIDETTLSESQSTAINFEKSSDGVNEQTSTNTIGIDGQSNLNEQRTTLNIEDSTESFNSSIPSDISINPMSTEMNINDSSKIMSTTTNEIDVTNTVEQNYETSLSDNSTIESSSFAGNVSEDFTVNSSNQTNDEQTEANTSSIIPTIEPMAEDESFNDTTDVSIPDRPVVPVCDLSCQCAKQCPYGFEIIDKKCQCDPPCKNYQCFSDDICVVNTDGRPVCQPNNGTVHDRPTRCYQPHDAGYHEEIVRYHSRWYYNPDQDTCHLFVYRGLGGNENNFQTLHECNIECITCAPAPDRGTCLGNIRMWYYDHKTSQCSQFEYSGCKGNDNKFLRKQDCLDTCVTRILNF